MKAAIYARSVAGEQTSVSDQMLLCKSLAARHSIRVVREYQDDTDEESLTRPGLAAMRHAMRRGDFNAIIVEDYGRLTRNPADLDTLVNEINTSGVRLISAKDGFEQSAYAKVIVPVIDS